jgi:hypothetical protein
VTNDDEAETKDQVTHPQSKELSGTGPSMEVKIIWSEKVEPACSFLTTKQNKTEQNRTEQNRSTNETN